MGRKVDVVVGGQWGSEGKGNIANFLSTEYATLMRVGGPNAGHYVLDDDGQKYCHRLLPSGSRRFHKPRILIGPGATLSLDLLLKEIRECDAFDRVTIHPQAAMISHADIEREQKLIKEIGSTGQGVGQCAARRILRNGTLAMAKDYPELERFVGDTTAILEKLLTYDVPVLLEGTQGTALSLYHGSYPHVTSRDTSVAGTCAEAGIAPTNVNRVFMVLRTHPIRVGTGGPGVSGPMSGETNWDSVASKAGLDPEWLADHERGSVSKVTRRVADFDFEQARRSAFINGATDIALTFADYLDPANSEARSFDDLTPHTQAFVEEIENRLSVPVSLISVGFFPNCIIDRRPDQIESGRVLGAPAMHGLLPSIH